MYAGRWWTEEIPPAARTPDINVQLDDVQLECRARLMGTKPEIIRDRVTHTKRRRDAFDGYDRGPHWPETR
jgi:hypothetical protein